jgi:hypothetical protein
MKRIQKLKKIRDTILIITNGKQTEKNYLNSITTHFKSMFTLKVEYKNYECDKLVEYAISKKTENFNQIWCLFDIDESYKDGHLLIALQNAKKHDIKIAYSNESFEVWLLLHLTDSVSPTLTRNKYIREINKTLQEKGINANYKKNDIELLKSLFIPNILEATQNAKKIYQKLEANHLKEYYGNTNYPIWDWKSSTTVFELIDTLKLTKRQDD